VTVYSITSLDHLKLTNFAQEMDAIGGHHSDTTADTANGVKRVNNLCGDDKSDTKRTKMDDKSDDLLESLLSLPTIREKQSKQMGEEILDLLSRPTAKERSLVEQFRSVGGAQVQEFCTHGTAQECRKASQSDSACNRLHFKKIIQKHTDESLGDCSFLNTCFHMDSCKYVHYLVDYSTARPLKHKQKTDTNTANTVADTTGESGISLSTIEKRYNCILFPAQWIKCDLRFFDMSTLGKTTGARIHLPNESVNYVFQANSRS
jgi:mRNA (2'-O-methyladenosine-N6-)-methyltransferase